MIERFLRLFGYVKIEKKNLEKINISHNNSVNRKLGKCHKCSNDATWRYSKGFLCHSCHDKICGLE
jgi:hypothetical protein